MKPKASETRLAALRAGSITWKLHREIVLLAGWGRAILLQLAHPLVARGVAEHSAFLSERWGRLWRLHRTLSAMLTLTFGTPEEVERVARTINAIHDRVHGDIMAPEGNFAPATRYTAHDPTLLAWVHATLVDSFLLTYELFVAPLTAEERDRYCMESVAIESLLAIPEGFLPRNTEALRIYMNSMLGGGQIAVTDTARALARQVVDPPALLIGRPLFVLLRLPTVGLLPPAIRRGYGFSWGEGQARALTILSSTARRLIPRLPSLLRHWSIARAALARERRAVARVNEQSG
jgi:uncharacterized protein (DUF2236 family)